MRSFSIDGSSADFLSLFSHPARPLSPHARHITIYTISFGHGFLSESVSLFTPSIALLTPKQIGFQRPSCDRSALENLSIWKGRTYRRTFRRDCWSWLPTWTSPKAKNEITEPDVGDEPPPRFSA